MDPRAKEFLLTLGVLERARRQKIAADKFEDRERAAKNEELDHEEKQVQEETLQLLHNEELREIEDKQRSLNECKERRINLSTRIETLQHDIASLQDELRSKQAELTTLESDNPSSATDGSPIDAIRSHFDLKRREKEQSFKQATLSRQEQVVALNRSLELERKEDEENYAKERKQLFETLANIAADINDPSSQELIVRGFSAELDPLEADQGVLQPDYTSENLQPAHPPPLAPMNVAEMPSVTRAMRRNSDFSGYPTTDTVCDVGFELLDAIAMHSLSHPNSPLVANAVQQRNHFVENEDATDTRSPTVQLLDEARLSLRSRKDVAPVASVDNAMAEAESDPDIEDIRWPPVLKENVSNSPVGTYKNHKPDRINLRLNKSDGLYIDPEYVAGVPVSRLSESDPSWIKSWSTQQDLLTAEDKRILKEDEIITQLVIGSGNALDGLGDISQTEYPDEYRIHAGKYTEIDEELKRRRLKRKRIKTHSETNKGLCSQRKTVNEMLMTLMNQPRFKEIQSAGIVSGSLNQLDGASNEDEFISTDQQLGDPAREEAPSPAEQIDSSNKAASPMSPPKRTRSGTDFSHSVRKARRTNNGSIPVNVTPLKLRTSSDNPQLLTPTSAKSITMIDLTTADSGSPEGASPQLRKRGRTSSRTVNTAIPADGVGNTLGPFNLASLTTLRHKKAVRVKDVDDTHGLVVLRYDPGAKTFKAWSTGPGCHPLTLSKLRKSEDVVIKVAQIKQVIRVKHLVEITWRLKKDESQPMLLEFQVDHNAKEFVRQVRTLNPDICKEENLPTEKALRERYELPPKTGGRTIADSSPKTSTGTLRRVDLNKHRVQQKSKDQKTRSLDTRY